MLLIHIGTKVLNKVIASHGCLWVRRVIDCDCREGQPCTHSFHHSGACERGQACSTSSAQGSPHSLCCGANNAVAGSSHCGGYPPCFNHVLLCSAWVCAPCDTWPATWLYLSHVGRGGVLLQQHMRGVCRVRPCISCQEGHWLLELISLGGASMWVTLVPSRAWLCCFLGSGQRYLYVSWE